MAGAASVGVGKFLDWLSVWVPALTLTPYQRAVCRVLGGEDPRDAIEAEVWGFTGPVPRNCRRVIAARLGRGSGKTMIAALYSLWRGFTCDLRAATGGAKVVVPVVAPGDLGRTLVLDAAIYFATNGPLRDFIHKERHDEARKREAVTSTSVSFLRPHDGKHWEIRALVASPGGSNLVGFWIPSGTIDEAERLRSTSEAKITDAEQIDAMAPRLLPDGTIVAISTPWNLRSYMHKHVNRNHGHPVDGLAAIATTRKMRPDSESLLTMIVDELQRNQAIAMRDYECIPLGRLDSYFDSLLVDRCKVAVATARKSQSSGGVDLAFISDGCALVIVERQGDRIVQVHEEFVQPSPTAPLQPSVIRARYAATLKAYGCSVISADVHEFSSLCETMLPNAIQVARAPTGENVTTAFAYVRDMMRRGQLSVLPETAEQMRLVLTKEEGGPKVPRTPGEGHADLVSALVHAVWLDRRFPMGASPYQPGSLRGGWVS